MNALTEWNGRRDSEPRSGDRMQPTAQAVGTSKKQEQPRQGRKKNSGQNPSTASLTNLLSSLSRTSTSSWKSGPLRAALRPIRMIRAFRPCVLLCLLAAAHAQLTPERLLNSSKEPQNWMTYSGDYSGKRFSSLDQINTANASHMVAKWVYQTAATGKLETTPLVVDGILYATAQDDRAFALDARTGRPIWLYQRQLPSDIRPCCGRVNRGLAILGDKVFMGTLDAHMMALDAKTGNVVWDVPAVDYTQGYSFTPAPLAVKNQVVIGVAGGEYGIRGFIDAYDAETG